jgi:hypothetical protein
MILHTQAGHRPYIAPEPNDNTQPMTRLETPHLFPVKSAVLPALLDDANPHNDFDGDNGTNAGDFCSSAW